MEPFGEVQPKNAPGVEARALEECMAALSTAPNAEKLAVPLLTDLKALGVHVERDVYARAVRSRRGRGCTRGERRCRRR